MDEAAVLMSGHEGPESDAGEEAERSRVERFRPKCPMPSCGLIEYLTEEERSWHAKFRRRTSEMWSHPLNSDSDSRSSSDSSLAEL